MNFDTPKPWAEAVADLESAGLMPTHLSSKEIREQWEKSIRERAIFSARNTNAQVLQGFRDQFKELLSGETNTATARLKMQELFDGLGYDAERGGFADSPVEPASAGSLRDLRSDRRIDLVLNTNTRQVANAAMRESGQSDYALFAFPAYELVRIYPREVPRGLRRTKDGLVEEPGTDWPSRWEECGGEFFDGRMIARKDDPIWDDLGDSETFDDGLDAPYPPFAFNSGYGWREIGRAECVALGVIDDDTDIQGTTASMNEGLKASADLDPDILGALRKNLVTEIEGDLVKMGGSSNASYLRKAAGL